MDDSSWKNVLIDENGWCRCTRPQQCATSCQSQQVRREFGMAAVITHRVDGAQVIGRQHITRGAPVKQVPLVLPRLYRHHHLLHGAIRLRPNNRPQSR